MSTPCASIWPSSQPSIRTPDLHILNTLVPYVILIHGLPSGDPSPYDETYLERFDFDDCPPGECNLFTVPDPRHARRFTDLLDATGVWKTIDPRQPLDWDGRPNRPLTIFSVTFEPVPD
jgi:hypothetical protein